MANTHCIVCGDEAKHEPQSAGNQKIDCDGCGVYLVSPTLNASNYTREQLGEALVKAKRHIKPGMLALLSEHGV